MMNQDQLAELLAHINVKALSAASGVSTKTIYRLRHKERAPNMGTVQKVMVGIAKLSQRAS